MPKVTFVPEGITIEMPRGTTLLAAAQASGAPVGYACGGHGACSTCHVYVLEGLASLEPADEKEEDILDKAFDVRPHSRLACQTRMGEQDVVCEITGESRKTWHNEHPA